MPRGRARLDLPYQLLLGCLLLSALLFLLSMLAGLTAPARRPALAYAQGYFISSPLVGAVRVVPLARGILRSPCSTAFDPDFQPLEEDFQPGAPRPVQNATLY